MIKIFISQPMRGLTGDQIRAERRRIEKMLKQKYGARAVKFITTDVSDSLPEDAKPLDYLGESLKRLGEADIAFFAKGWVNARGCKIENIAAREYGIAVLDENSL